jgi:hypothetical protein
MTPARCPVCQNENLFHGEIHAQTSQLAVYPVSFAFTVGAAPRCVVCLSCGSVQIYLPEDQLEKVKQWKAKGK